MNKEGRPESNGYIGIRDIAKLTGVSAATVPRVINNPEMTSEKVRGKVQKAIKRYSYIPNQPVKETFSKTSNTITAFIYDMENPFFTSLIRESNQICLEYSYIFPICDTGSNPELEKKYLYSCLANRCAGTILTEGIDSDIFEACRVHIPIVLLGREMHGKFSNVCSDNRQMMQPTVDCLYNLGHRKIAFVGCKTSMGSVISRQNNYIETMARRGLPVIRKYIYDRDLRLTLQAGSQAPSYSLSFSAAPTATIRCDDIIALGALNAAHSLGLGAPADVSTVGFDNITSNLHQPQVTAMRRNLWDISLELFELVINPPKEPVSKTIEVSFIEGATYSRVETFQE